MDKRKDDFYYASKISDYFHVIQREMDSVSFVRFSSSTLLQFGMMFALTQIAENAKKLTDAFKEKIPEIPWKDMAGLRNRVVHEYGSVDYSTVYETRKVDIPKAAKALDAFLAEEEACLTK